MSSYRQAGTVLTDHTFPVPLDHDRPEGERIEIFARELATADRASDHLPWLLFLQGGPGFGAPRPHGRDGWLGRALDDYRVLLPGQRGTGRSTPATGRVTRRGRPPAGRRSGSGPSSASSTRPPPSTAAGRCNGAVLDRLIALARGTA
jgi:pimeloyl-ACP methyl ester carboxylesterase